MKIIFFIYILSLTLLGSETNKFVTKCNETGDSVACIKAGAIYEFGLQGVEPDISKAISFVKKGCYSGCGENCNFLGRIYEKNNNPEAIVYYNKACKKSNGNGCYKIGFMYYLGSNGFSKDFKKALNYFLEACKNDYAQGCTFAGVSYKTGTGTKKDLATSKKFFAKACKLGSEKACKSFKELESLGI